MAKEKKTLFTKMEFNNAQYAMDVKAKSEAKLARVKVGLIIAAIAQFAWVISFAFPHMPELLVDGVCIIALVGTVAGYIVGGGLLAALKFTWKFATTIGWFGWVCVPFPVDIFTGIMLTGLALIMIPILFIFIPLGLVFLNFIQVRKDYKAAEEYLKYCTTETVADL